MKKTTESATFHENQTADAARSNDIMQVVLSRPRTSARENTPGTKTINGVVIGTFTGLSENSEALVDYPGIPGNQPLVAVTTESLTDFDSGRQVALSFVQGDPARPIVLGIIQNPGRAAKTSASRDQEVDVRMDGEKLELAAENEITLRCGDASITLTRAGKIILKGAYLSSHSTGVNRIRGGSVQIN